MVAHSNSAISISAQSAQDICCFNTVQTIFIDYAVLRIRQSLRIKGTWCKTFKICKYMYPFCGVHNLFAT